MQIIKPETIIWHEQVRYYQNKFLKIITGSIAFKLSDDTQLLSEHSFNKLWNEVAAGQALDDCYPKTLSEVLVLGESMGVAEVSVKIAAIDKTLKIFPERFWYPAPQLQKFWPYAPDPRIKNVAITWQNAYGGEAYALNPEGKGFVARRARLYDETARVALPLIEDPQHLLTEAFSDKDEVMPVCFAPLPMLHPLRWQYMQDAKWDNDTGKIPDDIDVLFFQQASFDQTQKATFKPNEKFSIAGMNKAGLIEGHLPKLYVRMFVQTKTQKFKEIKTAFDTVWLLPNQDIGVVTFRGIDEVGDWNGNDHEGLMLALDDSEQPKTLQFFSDAFMKMTGEERHLYRMSDDGKISESQLVALNQKTESLRQQMQKSIKAPAKISAKIMPTSAIQNMVFSTHSMRGEVWANYDFKEADFRGKVLENINFSGADLKGADFTEAQLKKVNFVGANLTGVRFNQAQLEEVLFTDNSLAQVNFSFAQLSECSFNKSVLNDSNLSHASFKNCQFFKTSWSNVNATHILMHGCLLSGGQWVKVKMPYAELLHLRVNHQVFQEVDFANSVGMRNGFVGQKTQFAKCGWEGAIWQDNNFLEAQFVACVFNNCSFPKSEWMSTRLTQVNFSNSDFAHNAFNDAEFNQSLFEKCRLNHSNWQGAYLKQVVFDNNFEFGMNLKMARVVT